MKPKLVLFTFDYELFLGNKSGSVLKCLLEPTERILEIFERSQQKAVFFIDTVYLLRMAEVKDDFRAAAEDYNAVIDQLVKIASGGHYIFPHIHGHWVDANYDQNSNEWSLTNLRYYCFSAVPNELQRQLFDKSVGLLKEIIARSGKEQPVNSYRAGGWSIQPFAAFMPFFRRHGIKYDWSVIPGKFLRSDAHSYDFINVPLEKTMYRFAEEVTSEDPKGDFVELTISSLIFTRFEKWLDFKLNGLCQRLYGKPMYHGRTVDLKIEREVDVVVKKKLQRVVASFEDLTRFRIEKFQHIIGEREYFQFISHPKLLSDRDLHLMERLLLKLKTKYNIQSDFLKS